MNEATTLATTTSVVTEQDKGRCAPAPGSDTSAAAWAEVGRMAMAKAQEAIERGHAGTAAGHRLNAEMAFGFELKLRQSNDQAHL